MNAGDNFKVPPLEQASLWWVRLRDDDVTPEEIGRWLDWCQDDPANLQAFADVDRLGGRLAALDAGTRAALVRDLLDEPVARKRPAPEEGHGVSVFLVPSVDETDGFTFERGEYLGMRGHVTGDSTFDVVAVDGDALLGEVGHGFRIAMGTIDMAR
ncbi:MAG: DUF4880 domain-containing protein, partial [Nevskia sp.]|nr:DUF4880 domain-containing protein [Nevskia sp.]